VAEEIIMSLVTLGRRRSVLAPIAAAAGATAFALSVLGDRAASAQDKYSVQVPDGLAFSEFKGYEGWQVVAISDTEELMAVWPIP
jgi:uncharacterized protein YcnI